MWVKRLIIPMYFTFLLIYEACREIKCTLFFDIDTASPKCVPSHLPLRKSPGLDEMTTVFGQLPRRGVVSLSLSHWMVDRQDRRPAETEQEPTTVVELPSHYATTLRSQVLWAAASAENPALNWAGSSLGSAAAIQSRSSWSECWIF